MVLRVKHDADRYVRRVRASVAALEDYHIDRIESGALQSAHEAGLALALKVMEKPETRGRLTTAEISTLSSLAARVLHAHQILQSSPERRAGRSSAKAPSGQPRPAPGAAFKDFLEMLQARAEEIESLERDNRLERLAREKKAGTRKRPVN